MTQAALLARRLLDWRPPPLRFADAELERRFEQACAPARLRHFIASGLVALIAFNLYLFSDRMMVPDMYEQALHMRLFLFTPVAIGLMLVSVMFKDWVLALPTAALEGLVMMTGVITALIIGAVLVQTSSPYGIMYRAGLMSILIYGNLVQRFRFRYALVFSASVLAICLASMGITLPRQHPFAPVDIPLTLLVLVIAIYTLIMNFRMELQERQRFVRTERAAAMRQEIEASRTALDKLSRQDALTDLPNRRHIDEVLRTSWDTHFASQDMLALLLIDVDHFKAYNDHYGHPTGDQCLRHVARAIQAGVPHATGCAARWGGEEFIVVLSDSDAQQAMQVAQSLTQAVAGLGLRHVASKTAGTVTISIGVAVAVPGHVLGSPDELISKADAALYRAKHEGRNRSVLASREWAGTAQG